MRGLILGLVCSGFLLGGLASVRADDKPKEKPADEKKDDKKDEKVKVSEEALAGKWKLVKTGGTLPDDHEFVIEYKAKGVMKFIRTPKDGGEAAVSDGKYKVVKDTIEWTVDEGGNERGETSKVKTLTADKLVLEDPEGITEEFEKVAEKKKDDKKEEKKKEEKKDK